MLNKQDLLKCRKCKNQKGDSIRSSKPLENLNKTRFYLICNQCNNNIYRIYRNKNKDKIKDIVNKYEDKNSEKRTAWGKVAYAIKKGLLEKPKECQICNLESRLDAHHKNYEKPLEVLFICRICHNAIHKGSIVV